jgi:hypothetical protein
MVAIPMVNLRDTMIMARPIAFIRMREMTMIMPTTCVSSG